MPYSIQFNLPNGKAVTVELDKIKGARAASAEVTRLTRDVGVWDGTTFYPPHSILSATLVLTTSVEPPDEPPPSLEHHDLPDFAAGISALLKRAKDDGQPNE